MLLLLEVSVPLDFPWKRVFWSTLAGASTGQIFNKVGWGAVVGAIVGVLYTPPGERQ